MTASKEQIQLIELLERQANDLKYNQLKYIFPETGPYRKELYPKHIAFMYAGKSHAQRLFCGGNRIGKTRVGGTEMAYHLTGLYPKDWKGRVFLNPVSAWAIGVTNQSVKEIQQLELLGPFNDVGSGMIPKELIVSVTKKPGIAGAVESVTVKHRSGGVSELIFKSYEQGRDNFQGTKKQVIWLDEEPRDYGIYEECLMRTMDDVAPGIIYCTFTPLFGMSKMVLSFLKDGVFPPDGVHPDESDKYVTQVTWDEVPHLSEDQKKKLVSSIAPHLRDARTKGLPSLGVGALYPYPEDEITCSPFQIPEWWPRAYGLDVGWNKTAAVWLTQDPSSLQLYVYSEHYESFAQPVVHAHAIMARGAWLTGAIDPASLGSSQIDGKRLIDLYEEAGLDLVPADNSIESGILDVGQAFASGQLKIFTTCSNLISELRKYHRDENGRIVKKDDHALDALRYVKLAFNDISRETPDGADHIMESLASGGRDSITGY